MKDSLLYLLARRFVAGGTAEEAVQVAQKMNARGVQGIIDFLGEDVRSAKEAVSAAEEYMRLMDLIAQARAQTAVSLKMSQMGLLISTSLCEENLTRVLQRASQNQNFVWIDMEGSALTQQTIGMFERLHERFEEIGLCLQAYLVRTGGDLDRLMRRAVTIRLCKGAYKESSDIAFVTKAAVDANYRMLVQKLLDHVGRGVFPAFATHDPDLIDFIVKTVKDKRVESRQFEFQMLYGIQNKLLQSLSNEGYGARVYIPYGKAWLPYFTRRLRERKENVYFLLRNLFRL